MSYMLGEPNAQHQHDIFQIHEYAHGGLDHSPSQQFPAHGQEYLVTFKLFYETKFFENIFIVGDIPELGSDRDTTKCPLKWTEGHIWVTEKPILTRTPVFRYRYVMVDEASDNQVKDQERGVRRIADLASLQGGNTTESEHGYRSYHHGGAKTVEIHDEWETLKVRFTVFHPHVQPNQTLRLTGNTEELGNWDKVNPIQLKPVFGHYYGWDSQKYGEDVLPYEVTVTFKNQAAEATSLKPLSFNYSYSLWGGVRNEVEWERDPPRRLEVLNSDTYKGELGLHHTTQWLNTSQCWFVNGIIEKNDGNFFKNFFVS